jgi:exodeoxyribonuclease VII large subunit
VRDASQRRVKIERQSLVALRAQLRALDPQRTLERGFVMIQDEAGDVVTSAAQIKPGQRLQILWRDGAVTVMVVPDE